MPARYMVRVEDPERGIQDLSIGTDPAAEIRFARSHWRKHGWKIWCWCVKSGTSVYRLERYHGTPGERVEELARLDRAEREAAAKREAGAAGGAR